VVNQHRQSIDHQLAWDHPAATATATATATTATAATATATARTPTATAAATTATAAATTANTSTGTAHGVAGTARGVEADWIDTDGPFGVRANSSAKSGTTGGGGKQTQIRGCAREYTRKCAGRWSARCPRLDGGERMR